MAECERLAAVEEARLPSFPRYSWEQVWRLVQGLARDPLLRELRAGVQRPESLQRLAKRMAAYFSGVDVSILEESLRVYAGRVLDTDQWLRVCWLLAGNTSRLRRGQPVYFWSSQTQLEWAPLKIIRIQALVSRPDQFQVVCWAWGGSAAATEFACQWSRNFCFAVGRRLGFSRRNGRYPMRHPVELYGLLCYGLLEPRCSHPQSPKFTKVAASARQQQCNRQLLRHRLRRPLPGRRGPHFVCPQGLPDSFPCYRCPCGEDRCPVACRDRTLERGVCARCGQQTWLEVAVSPDEQRWCRGCRQRNSRV